MIMSLLKFMPVTQIRRMFEHLTFVGASSDFLSTATHHDSMMVVLFGKFAFVAGCIGVYLAHAEELRKAKARADWYEVHGSKV